MFMSQKHLPKIRQNLLENSYQCVAEKLKIMHISHSTISFEFLQHVIQILVK